LRIGVECATANDPLSFFFMISCYESFEGEVNVVGQRAGHVVGVDIVEDRRADRRDRRLGLPGRIVNNLSHLVFLRVRVTPPKDRSSRDNGRDGPFGGRW